MDDRYKVTGEEERSSGMNKTSDGEWKQFVKQELDKLENQGKEESPSEKGFSLGNVMEKIPVEDLIRTTVDVVKNRAVGGGNTNKKNSRYEKRQESIEPIYHHIFPNYYR